jgi:hypothetical protein
MKMEEEKFKNIVGLKKEWMWMQRLYQQTISLASTEMTYTINNWNLILLLTVVYFKHYPNFEFMAFIFDIADSTLRKYVDTGILILSKWSTEKIKIPQRLYSTKNSIHLFGKKISLVFDIKEQKVITSTDPLFEDICFSGKYMEHTVSTLVGCDTVLYLPRKKNDQSIADHYDWNQILDDDEFILADQGFSGSKIVKKKINLNLKRK